MKKRTKKLLSVLLAASMVFSMNTIAFAEEVAVDEADAVLETADVVAEDAAVAEADAELSDEINYNDKGECITKVTYAKDSTDKKATLGTIATITGTDNPVSWNNSNATDFIYTVLYGNDLETGALNNTKGLTVSQQSVRDINNKEIEGLRRAQGSIKYDVVTVKDGEIYLLVGYSLVDGWIEEWVEGHDGFIGDNNTWNWDSIPVIEYDGRTVDFNKSGNYKYAANKKEALDVQVALVKYENGTVTEFPGVSVTAKVDQKVAKNASVAVATTEKEFKYKYHDYEYSFKEDEHATLGDLPYFTITVKAKDKDAKAFSKELKDKLKDKKFYFGIMQGCVDVNDITGKYASYINNHPGKTVSNNEEIKAVEDAIADSTMKYNFGGDHESIPVGNLTLSKFNGSKGTLTREFKASDGEGLGDLKKGYTKDGKVTLKEGVDYKFSDGTLAGETVKVLEFEGNNWVYNPSTGDPSNNLAGYGYKWAFRMTPGEKTKTFRYGIYKDTDNGFVFSTED